MASHYETLQNGFPGPRLAGALFILAPLVFMTGASLSIPFEQTNSETTQALVDSPRQAELVMNLLFAGAVLLGACIVALARLIAVRRPVLAAWGGGFALAATYVTALFQGVMMYEVPLAGIADRALADSINTAAAPPLVMFLALPGWPVGWLLLGVGVWRAGIFSLPRAIALACPALVPLAVLVEPMLLPVPFLGLAIAIVPLGMRLLFQRAGATGGPNATTA